MYSLALADEGNGLFVFRAFWGGAPGGVRAAPRGENMELGATGTVSVNGEASKEEKGLTAPLPERSARNLQAPCQRRKVFASDAKNGPHRPNSGILQGRGGRDRSGAARIRVCVEIRQCTGKGCAKGIHFCQQDVPWARSGMEPVRACRVPVAAKDKFGTLRAKVQAWFPR